MSKNFFLSGILLFVGTSLARADAIMYPIFVDTSSVMGTTGSLDFNFNPGPLVSQSAYAQVFAFVSNGAPVGSSQLVGDVSGSLPGSITFDNRAGFNDYFQGFTYGAELSFEVALYGPALTAPDATSTSGSAFAFSMFSDLNGTTPALTTDLADGFAYTIQINLDGTTTATDFIASSGGSPAQPSPVPEPATIGLFGLGSCLSGIIASLRKKKCP